MNSILQCKTVFTDKGGFCAIDDSLTENPDGTYTLDRVKQHASQRQNAEIKEQDVVEKMKISKESAYLFRSNAKFFYATKGDAGIYRLTSIKGTDVRNVQRKGENLGVKLTYKDPSKLSQGTYGSVIQFPSENLIYKSSRQTNIEEDFIKEIGVYNLFKQFTCLPEFHDLFISSEKNPVMVLNKGFSTLTEAKLDFNQKKIAMFQILKCMRLFNSQGLIHLDLKPPNILINKDILNNQNINTQIIDWGICAVDHCPWAYSNITGSKQTLWWRSPEVLMNKPYNYKADIFSIGIILGELIMLSDLKYEYWFPVQSESEYISMLKKDLIGIKTVNISVADLVDWPVSLKHLIAFNIVCSNQNYFDFKVKENYNPIELDRMVLDMFENRKYNMINEIESLIQKWRLPDEPEKENFLDLLASMMEFNPRFRISYEDAIIHPYFQNIKRQSYSQFPIFLNRIDKLNVDLDKIYSEKNWNKREKLISNIFKMPKTSDEAKFLTIQLLDAMILESKDQEFESLLDSALFISRCIYSYKDDFPETDEFLKLSKKPDNEAILNAYRNQILNDIKLLNYKLIVPSLYSYWVYHNRKIPNQSQIEAMLDVYNYSDFYAKDFESWLKFLEELAIFKK